VVKASSCAHLSGCPKSRKLGTFDAATVSALRFFRCLSKSTLAKATDTFTKTVLTPSDFGRPFAEYVAATGSEALQAETAQALAQFGTGFA
jgi:hypothetical protein